MGNDRQFNKAVEEAAERISALPKGYYGGIGQAVDKAVADAGGGAKVLFAVTEALARKVPFSARNLRRYRREFLLGRIVERTARDILRLVSDPGEDWFDIGRLIGQAVCEAGGSKTCEVWVLEGIAADLGVSPQLLRRYRDSYRVIEFCRPQPNDLRFRSAGEAYQLSRILKADERWVKPWQKKDLVLQTANEISREALRPSKIVQLVSAKIAAAVEAGKASKSGKILIAPSSPAVEPERPRQLAA